jgi:hypothetical protein
MNSLAGKQAAILQKTDIRRCLKSRAGALKGVNAQ